MERDAEIEGQAALRAAETTQLTDYALPGAIRRDSPCAHRWRRTTCFATLIFFAHFLYGGLTFAGGNQESSSHGTKLGKPHCELDDPSQPRTLEFIDARGHRVKMLRAFNEPCKGISSGRGHQTFIGCSAGDYAGVILTKYLCEVPSDITTTTTTLDFYDAVGKKLWSYVLDERPRDYDSLRVRIAETDRKVGYMDLRGKNSALVVLDQDGRVQRFPITAATVERDDFWFSQDGRYVWFKGWPPPGACPHPGWPAETCGSGIVKHVFHDLQTGNAHEYFGMASWAEVSGDGRVSVFDGYEGKLLHSYQFP